MGTWSSADAIEPDLHSLLLAACMLGDVEQIKRALVSGADLACARTVRGEGALTLAAARGSRECVDALIESGASDAKCAAGSTALMAAAARGHVECVRSLLSVSNPRARDADGWTALHYAASERDPGRAVSAIC